jgi:hypothetical protein
MTTTQRIFLKARKEGGAVEECEHIRQRYLRSANGDEDLVIASTFRAVLMRGWLTEQQLSGGWKRYILSESGRRALEG